MALLRLGGVLADIVRDVEESLPSRKREIAISTLERMAEECGPPRHFKAALSLPAESIGARWRIIAEIKRASPSRGIIREDLDVEAVAKAYEDNGAVAISVLTEPRYFRGEVGFLRVVRGAADLPVLRKDFLFDPYQVYEARAWGADAFLLIAAILETGRLKELIALGRELGMDALVEVHDENELGRALEAGCEIIGINNRNLVDFTVDLSTTVELSRRVPEGKTIVSESGIRSSDDLIRLGREGVSAFLVGEALLSGGDIGGNLRRLNGWQTDPSGTG